LNSEPPECGPAHSGSVCALLAIAPAYFARGDQLRELSLAVLLGGVLLSGLTAFIITTGTPFGAPLLPARRANEIGEPACKYPLLPEGD
jgi:hypothetical protein